MLTKLKTVVFGIFVLASSLASAQKKDSVRLLSEVIVEQSRLNSYSISQYALPVDSMTRTLASGGSLADMLRKSGFGHIRSYGPGGLASASLRGTGSSHTAVLWNGLNLISPLNGQLDLSLVPVGFFDDASVQSGGSASLYGNGSIGGTIQLNNKASFNEGLTLKTFSNAGSFGSYYQDLSVSFSYKKFISSTKVFLNQAKNDFDFTNRNVFPIQVEKREHTAYDQKGILQQNYWQLSTQHLLTFKLWAQDNLYEIPSSTTVSKKSEATERNKFYRTVIGWTYNRTAFDFNYQSAFVCHDLNYTDPVTNLTSPSTFNTFINNLELNFSLKKSSSLTTGINYTWEQGIVDAFGSDAPIRNRIALFGAFKWKPGQRWDIVTSLREEIINGNTTPAAPSLTAKMKLSKILDLYSNISRNYRIPTFNDLYWKGVGGLGNPDLKPEISLGGEVGFNITSARTELSDIILSLKTAIFSNHVDNWILWSPVNPLFWSPHNIKKVWSRGIETNGSARKQFHNVNLELTAHYSFTQATNQDIYEDANPNELDKQLILTPMHEAAATFRLIWKGYYFNVVNSFIGKQYTDTDNTEFSAMKSYNTNQHRIWKTNPFPKIKGYRQWGT